MAKITYTLRQTTSIEDGPLYRVKNIIGLAEGASGAVFVYKTTDDKFSHYATALDMELWPDSKEQALLDSLNFYRQKSVTHDWATVALMNEDLALTVVRVRALAEEMSALQEGGMLDRIVTISAGA